MLVDEPLHLVAADLLVERVQELLASRRARVGGAVELRASEAAEVEQSLGRAVEHDPHTVEQVDDAGRRVAHRLDRRLVREKVPSIDRVVEMDLGRVPFPFRVHRSVDPALGANGMAPLDRNDREEVDADAHLGGADGRHQAGQASTDDDHALGGHRAITRGTPGSIGCR